MAHGNEKEMKLASAQMFCVLYIKYTKPRKTEITMISVISLQSSEVEAKKKKGRRN